MGKNKHCLCANCGATRNRSHLTCRNCWVKVPKNLRDQVWETYKVAPGSDAHRSACAEVFRFLINEEGKCQTNE